MLGDVKKEEHGWTTSRPVLDQYLGPGSCWTNSNSRNGSCHPNFKIIIFSFFVVKLILTPGTGVGVYNTPAQ
jgi:hypothetical protein